VAGVGIDAVGSVAARRGGAGAWRQCGFDATRRPRSIDARARAGLIRKLAGHCTALHIDKRSELQGIAQFALERPLQDKDTTGRNSRLALTLTCVCTKVRQCDNVHYN